MQKRDRQMNKPHSEAFENDEKDETTVQGHTLKIGVNCSL
jgi:hypothetical protein